MNANDRQVGGDHYKRFKYQHWDFAIDAELPWPIACAMKYICRWRNKNGVEDLEKVIHYVEKAMERNVLNKHSNYTHHQIDHMERARHREMWQRFIEQFEHGDDKFLGYMLWSNCHNTMIKTVKYMIKEQEALKNANH